jgi:excisionase family DNA binding protein
MAETVSHARDLTVEEAAARMRTHPETVRRWLRKGLLPHAYKTPTGYGWRIPSSDLDALQAVRSRPAPLTFGIIADGSLPARDAEEYLRAHWPQA